MKDNTDYVYYGIICKEFNNEFMIVKMRDGFIVTEKTYTHKFQPDVVRNKTSTVDPFENISTGIVKVNNAFFIVRKHTREYFTQEDTDGVKSFLNDHFNFGDKSIHVYDYISKDYILVPIFRDFDEMEKRLRDFMDKIIEVEKTTSIEQKLDDGTNHIVVKKTFDDKYFIVGKLYKMKMPYEKPYDVSYGILEKFEPETLYFHIFDRPNCVDPNEYTEISIASVERLRGMKIERMFTADDVADVMQSVKATIVGKPSIFKYR